MKDMVGSVSLWSFLQVAGMSSDDYQTLVTGAQAELERTELKLYFNVFVPSWTPFQAHTNMLAVMSVTGRSQDHRAVVDRLLGKVIDTQCPQIPSRV